MATTYDLNAYSIRFWKDGSTPDGESIWTWVPGHAGRVIGGWACYESKPTASTAAVTVEIGDTDAITWTFTSASTDYHFVAGNLSTTDTDLYFDTDDVLHLDATSANKNEATLSVWLLVQGR